MKGTAKCLVSACALIINVFALAEEPPQTATVLGVELALTEEGQPAAVDEATRLQLIANLRASFAALGVNAQSGPLRIAADGSESMQLGLEHTDIAVARIGPDGALVLQCVHGEEKAASFLAGGAEQ